MFVSSSTTRISRLLRYAKRFVKPAVYYALHPMSALRKDEIAMSADGLYYTCSTENQIERMILQTGVWEPWETMTIRKLVQPGWSCFDIGANIGYFTILLAKQVGGTGSVHAFEPTTWAYLRMLGNISLNTNEAVEVIRLNKRGLLSANTHREEALEARFSARLLAHTEPEKIRFITVDSYCHDHCIARVDFVKIDIDGHDVEAMMGSRVTLKRCRPLVMAEFCQRLLHAHDSSVNRYIDLFTECGYDHFISELSSEPSPLRYLLEREPHSEISTNILIFSSESDSHKQLFQLNKPNVPL
jgi:FkbM family methyltransferase